MQEYGKQIVFENGFILSYENHHLFDIIDKSGEKIRFEKITKNKIDDFQVNTEGFGFFSKGLENYSLISVILLMQYLSEKFDENKIFLDKVKNKLKHNERCYLISTQLIEAGVDLSFKKVIFVDSF